MLSLPIKQAYLRILSTPFQFYLLHHSIGKKILQGEIQCLSRASPGNRSPSRNSHRDCHFVLRRAGRALTGDAVHIGAYGAAPRRTSPQTSSFVSSCPGTAFPDPPPSLGRSPIPGSFPAGYGRSGVLGGHVHQLGGGEFPVVTVAAVDMQINHIARLRPERQPSAACSCA